MASRHCNEWDWLQIAGVEALRVWPKLTLLPLSVCFPIFQHQDLCPRRGKCWSKQAHSRSQFVSAPDSSKLSPMHSLCRQQELFSLLCSNAASSPSLLSASQLITSLSPCCPCPVLELPCRATGAQVDSWRVSGHELWWSSRHQRSRRLLMHSLGERCSVVCDSLRPHGLYNPWHSPCQNTGVGSCSLLQRIFPTQVSNSGLLHCRQILYQLSLNANHGHCLPTQILPWNQAACACHRKIWVFSPVMVLLGSVPSMRCGVSSGGAFAQLGLGHVSRGSGKPTVIGAVL